MPRVALTDAQTIDQLSERDAFALTILGDARGEEIEGRIAVACAVRQRVLDLERWPDDYKGVCLQKAQFSCWNQGDINRALLLRAARALVTGNLKSNPLSVEQIHEAQWIADGVINGVVRDRSGFGGANHYVTRALWESASPPQWLRGQSPTCLVQHHAFFRL